LILSVILLSANANSKIHEFETTRLKSSGGAGIGAIYTEETAFLNPASLAFFTDSSVYVQKDLSRLTYDGVGQPRPKSLGFVMSDGNPSLSGSLSYVTQEEEIYKRKRWGLSLSSPLTETSSFGISTRLTTDENTSTNTSKKYYQVVLGVTHLIDEKLSIGIVAYDPFRSAGQETKALIGLQYIVMSYITAALDFGGNYYADDITKTLTYKAAIQVKILNDFYLRFGGFNDLVRSEKGNGYGLAWIQPRLSLEIALKNTKRSKDISINQSATNLKETSLALAFKF
jgi:hypothetical protein